MPQGEVVIDPFTGQSMSREALDGAARARTGAARPARRRRRCRSALFLQPATPREIIARMLRNLKEIHRSADDWAAPARGAAATRHPPARGVGGAARPRPRRRPARRGQDRRWPTCRPTSSTSRTPATASAIARAAARARPRRSVAPALTARRALSPAPRDAPDVGAAAHRQLGGARGRRGRCFDLAARAGADAVRDRRGPRLRAPSARSSSSPARRVPRVIAVMLVEIATLLAVAALMLLIGADPVEGAAAPATSSCRCWSSRINQRVTPWLAQMGINVSLDGSNLRAILHQVPRRQLGRRHRRGAGLGAHRRQHPRHRRRLRDPGAGRAVLPAHRLAVLRASARSRWCRRACARDVAAFTNDCDSRARPVPARPAAGRCS